MPSINLYLNNHKYRGKSKDELVPIQAFFYESKAEKFMIATREYIAPKFWDSKKQKAKPQYNGHVSLNKSLSDFCENLKDLYRKNRDMEFGQFKLLAKRRLEKKTLRQALDQFIEKYEREASEKTFKKYKALKTHIDGFGRVPNGLREVEEFRMYLQAEKEKDGKKIEGLIDSSANKYIVNLKTFLEWADATGYEVDKSFKKIKLTGRDKDPISISEAELKAIENLQLTGGKDIARDYFLFECYTGQRISDIIRFNKNDFDGTRWTFYQRKGNRIRNKRTTVLFKGFCASGLRILEKYDYQMPPIAEQTMNDYLKEIGKEAGLTTQLTIVDWRGSERIETVVEKWEKLTSHIGRKTFITLALDSGMPVKQVSQLLNVSINTINKHYAAKSDESVTEMYLNKMVKIA